MKTFIYLFFGLHLNFVKLWAPQAQTFSYVTVDAQLYSMQKKRKEQTTLAQFW